LISLYNPENLCQPIVVKPITLIFTVLQLPATNNQRRGKEQMKRKGRFWFNLITAKLSCFSKVGVLFSGQIIIWCGDHFWKRLRLL